MWRKVSIVSWTSRARLARRGKEQNARLLAMTGRQRMMFRPYGWMARKL